MICAGPEVERTPVTVVLPFAGDRAMVTYEPDGRSSIRDAIARLEPRAVVTNATQLELVPHDVNGYATVGDSEAGALAQHIPPELGRLRALLMNDLEAQRITGMTTPGGRGAPLANHVETVVVSRGAARRGGGVRRRARHRLRPRRSRPATRRERATCSSPATSPAT